MATAEAISMVGAKPVFVDIDPVTYCMSVEQAAAAITNATKAIVAVHLYGHSVDMDAINALAEKHGLAVVEDACQAHGAEYKGRRIGTLGDLACFSFFPGKNLGAYGDAGGVTGNDEELLTRVARLRNHGRQNKYEHSELGFGERMDTLQAAVLNVKLPYLDQWTELRRQHARAYNERLTGLDMVLPVEQADCRHVYHLYVIRVKERDRVLKYLNDKDIGAGIHYPVPLHKQPAYRNLGYDQCLPETEKAAAEILSLPIFPELSEAQIDYICSALTKAVK
jgi:dTDP-4-amino-4,6-dideoxygalactose transaminase